MKEQCVVDQAATDAASICAEEHYFRQLTWMGIDIWQPTANVCSQQPRANDTRILQEQTLAEAALQKAGLPKAGLQEAALQKAGLPKAGLQEAALPEKAGEEAALQNEDLCSATEGHLPAYYFLLKPAAEECGDKPCFALWVECAVDAHALQSEELLLLEKMFQAIGYRYPFSSATHISKVVPAGLSTAEKAPQVQVVLGERAASWLQTPAGLKAQLQHISGAKVDGERSHDMGNGVFYKKCFISKAPHEMLKHAALKRQAWAMLQALKRYLSEMS